MEKQGNTRRCLPNNSDDCIEKAIRGCTTAAMLDGMEKGIRTNKELDQQQRTYYRGLLTEQRQVLQRRKYGGRSSPLQSY